MSLYAFGGGPQQNFDSPANFLPGGSSYNDPYSSAASSYTQPNYGAPASYMDTNFGSQPSYMGAPQPNYGAPPVNYGAPTYGNPQPNYMGAPPQPNYGAPPGNYGAPNYGNPQASYMGGPPQPNYGAPPQPNYGAPNYGNPQASYMAGPPQPNYGAAPPQPNYALPPSNIGCGPQAMSGMPGAGVMVDARSGYVKTTGAKRAVVVGINYVRSTKGQLRGCINDTRNIREFLLRFGQFPPDNIVVMTDDQPPNSKFYPSKSNMLSAMNWLVAGAGPDDSLFFHYSGHGGQSEDKTGLEDDGMNETILPADWETVGMIDDDTLHAILVKNLPAGCKFTAIFDSCHSGTVLDLPYVYKSQEAQYKNAHKAEGTGFFARHKKFSITKVVTSEMGYQVKKKFRGALNKAINATKADVIQFSGCRDEQTSADATIQNQATGAMSYAFIETLKASTGQISYAQLLTGMRNVLHNGPKKYSQVPQLSYGNPNMDMNQPFLL